MIILGLDLSLNCPGYAVIEGKKGIYNLLEVGHIKAKPKHSLTQKLKRIQAHILKLTMDYDIDVVVRESGFIRFNTASKALERVVGAVYSTLDYDVIELPPTTIKKRITGSGNASKEEVEQSVLKLIYMPENIQFNSDDESDAVAVCIAYLIGDD